MNQLVLNGLKRYERSRNPLVILERAKDAHAGAWFAYQVQPTQWNYDALLNARRALRLACVKANAPYDPQEPELPK